jgi:hypothetical protein
MDRDELDQKIRRRRPGEGTLRRGTQLGRDAEAGPVGYAPFAPEPEDAMAVREPDAEQPAANIDNTPADFDRSVPPTPQEFQEPPPYGPPPDVPQAFEQQAYEQQAYAQPAYPQQAYEEPVDQAPYGAPEDAYPYPAAASGPGGGRRGGGSSALPIIGFIVLCVLALGVGAVLAGVLGGNGGVADRTATPSASESAAASLEPSAESSGSTPEQSSATPEPTDGPITFADGAILSIQPCGSGEYKDDAVGHPDQDACKGDGSAVSGDEAWAFVVFAHASGSDSFTVTLRLDDDVVNEQEFALDSVLDNCGTTCSGLIYGAHYVDLPEGKYTLTLRRNGDFADSASFSVEG